MKVYFCQQCEEPMDIAWTSFREAWLFVSSKVQELGQNDCIVWHESFEDCFKDPQLSQKYEDSAQCWRVANVGPQSVCIFELLL